MAVTGTHLTTGADTTDATSFATASISPGASRLVLVWVASRAIGVLPNAPTLTGNGLTYVQAATVEFHSVASPFQRLTLFRAMGAAPSTEAITIDFAGQTQSGCSWSVSDYSSVDTTGTNGSGAVVQSATGAANTGTSLVVTLAAFGSVDNATAGGFVISRNEAITIGAGFTELGQAGIAGPIMTILSQWRADNDTTVDASWTTSSENAGGAVEIKAGAPPPPATSLIYGPHPLHSMIGR